MLPGGDSWIGTEHDCVLPVVSHAVHQQIPVAAICNAVTFLAEHGYLDAVRHTGNTLAFLKQTAPHYQGEKNFWNIQAICDGGIITANGTAALEFSREILRCLKIMLEEKIAARYAFNKSGFYPES